MKLYNLYLIKKIVSYFLVIITVLALLVWFSKAVSLIRFVTEKGVSIADFFNLFTLILPWLLLIIIPISLFIAVLTAYNQMLSHNEITILRNSGLDKMDLAKPAITVAIICMIICFFISFFLMPYANKKLRTTKTDFENNYSNLVISPGIFENLNSLTIYVKTRNSTNELSGILIHDNRNSDHSTIITSKTGVLRNEDSAILLYLNDGTVQRSDYKTRKSDILRFDSYVVNLKENNNLDVARTWKASERYINELIYPEQNASKTDLAKYYVEIHQRITYPFLSIVLTMIACAFILSGKFQRHGNLIHNIKAVIVSTVFVSLMMLSYDLIETSPNFVILLYADLLFFIVGSFLILKSKKNI